MIPTQGTTLISHLRDSAKFPTERLMAFTISDTASFVELASVVMVEESKL